MACGLEDEKLKIRQILSATIASLCNNGLNFNLELRIEGLIGITLDRESVFLVNINEVLPSKKKRLVETQSKRNFGTVKSNESQTRHKRSNETSTTIKIEPHSPQSRNDPEKNSQDSFQDPNCSVKEEHAKVVSERLETECLSMQQHGGGYAEVQKSVKTVQHPEGVVEQKQVEWKTYDASGRVLEHKKVEAVQTMAQPVINSGSDAQYVNSDLNQPDVLTQSNEMYDAQQQNYYYDQGFENYSQEFSNEQGYYEQQTGFDNDFSCDGQTFLPSPGAKKGTKRGAKRGSRGGTSSRTDLSGDQRHSAASGKSSARNKPKSRQQFQQPPQKKQCFQQQFQEPYSSGQSRVQGPYASQKQPATKTRPGKDLLKRAMHLVTEGKVSAGTAINLFGIPKSTFYKELSNYKKMMEGYQGDEFENEEGWTDNPGENAEYDYSGYEGYQ